jgi:hypothetical protein
MPQSLFPRRPVQRYVPTLEALEDRLPPTALPIGLPIIPTGPIINFPTVNLPTPGTGTPSTPNVPAPQAGTNAAAQVSVTRGRLRYSHGHRRAAQTLTLTNTGGAPAGPLGVRLDGLGSRVRLLSAPTVSGLAPGQSLPVLLRFANPSGKAISFTPVVTAMNP